jgi:SAM-dependent methyltransferase
VLEVGCVNSPFIYLLPGLGARVTGVDLRSWGERAGGFTFIRGDVLDLELPTFDVVLCISTLEHIGLGRYPGDATEEGRDGRVLRRMVDLLNPAGRLLVTVPVGTADESRAQRIDAYRTYRPTDIPTLVESYGRIQAIDYYVAESRRWQPALADVAARSATALGCYLIEKL